MRITTNAMMRNYNSSLLMNLENVNAARERVSSKRRYSKASEDPASAQRAAQLQRRYLRNEDYIDTVETAQIRQDTADSALQQISKLVSQALNSDSNQAASDSNSSQRHVFATTLRGIQNSLVEVANTSYEGKYLFAGADGANLPFSLDTTTTPNKVTYRGLDVSDPANKAALDALLDEKLYIDIGLGIKTTTGNAATNASEINGASVMDVALTGNKLFGYGTTGDVDSNGDPISKNVIALLGQMADELEKDPLDHDIFNKMQAQLQAGHDSIVDFNSTVGVKSRFLETTKGRLEDEQINLYTQLDSIENIQPTEAIMDFSYSQYAYNMLLKVGTSLLSNSFIDFMR